MGDGPDVTDAPRDADVDTSLMVRAARGDLAAFEQLVRRNQSIAWSLAWRYLSDSSEARDVAQDAFLRIYKAASRYRPIGKFRTYLSRVVTRLCLDRLARKRPEYMGELPAVTDPSRSPEDQAIGAELRSAVRQCLSGLPPNQRVAIVLRQYEGSSYDEIAHILEVSPKAVDSLLQRARSTLRECLAVHREG
jgi:RNA polymerase sigma-70 factor, ECF subfamily